MYIIVIRGRHHPIRHLKVMSIGALVISTGVALSMSIVYVEA